MEDDQSSMEDCVKYFLRNATVDKKDLDKDEIKQNLERLELNVEKGLSSRDLNVLARHVVFTRGYDFVIRRKILYCLVPEGSDFPYEIIPLAVSNCTEVPVNPTWQASVLSWLCSLLEHGVIDAYNKFIHICYSAFFNLTSSLSLVLLSCRVLGFITRLEDVTAWRANILLHLKDKPGFYDRVSHLLRIYQLFRPDLIYGKLSYKHFPQTTPRVLKKGVMALRTRLEENEAVDWGSSSGEIWPAMNKPEKANAHQRPTAIPRPDNTYYSGTMEEKTQKKIFVSQYQRFPDLVNGLPNWKVWKWPNNPATHLGCPIIIPLFRPDDPTVLITLTNWLQVALRAELIECRGKPHKERCENLLKAVHDLVKVTGTQIPIVNDFLVDYMSVWDQRSHFPLVLSLMEYSTYVSAEFTSHTYFRIIAELLDNAPLVKWCMVVETVGNTAAVWAVRAMEEAVGSDKYINWPRKPGFEDYSSIIGLWFLVNRMERFFSAAVVEYKCHPMVVHHIIDFYVKVNMYSEVLSLPVVFLPRVPFTLALTTQSDLASVHRWGKLLSSIPAAVERIKEMNVHGPESEVQAECLSMCESFNMSVRIFLQGVYVGSAFGSFYKKLLDPFYSFNFLQKIISSPSARKFAHVTHALPYLPYCAQKLIELGDRELEQEEAKELRDEVIAKLDADGFSGITKCIRVYIK